ncbi:MAG: hypothetical protein RI922_1785 [Bacteroidota bacterium]|jgi:hypothetical protein
MDDTKNEYKFYMSQMIALIKDKSTYLKTIDKNSSSYNKDHFEGMADAYFFILDGIKSYIESNEDLSLEELGLNDYDPNEIFNYNPKE